MALVVSRIRARRGDRVGRSTRRTLPREVRLRCHRSLQSAGCVRAYRQRSSNGRRRRQRRMRCASRCSSCLPAQRPTHRGSRRRHLYNPRKSTVSLTVGTRLGVYEVVGLLGAGGMGEVYRARDTKPGRDVALKGPAWRPRNPCRQFSEPRRGWVADVRKFSQPLGSLRADLAAEIDRKAVAQGVASALEVDCFLRYASPQPLASGGA